MRKERGMIRTRTRAAVALVLAALLVVGIGAPASAATDVYVPPETRPAPVNVLPSTVKEFGRLTTGSDLVEYNARAMTMVYSYAIRNPEVVAAMKAKANATPEKPVTPRQLQTIKTATKGFRLPAFRPTALTKLAGGPVGIAMAGVSLGLLAMEGIPQLVGLDAEGIYCDGGIAEGVHSLFGGLNCDGVIPDSAYVVNTDVPTVPRWGKLCSPNGVVCLQPSHDATLSSGQTIRCVRVTGMTRVDSWVIDSRIRFREGAAGAWEPVSRDRVAWCGTTSSLSDMWGYVSADSGNVGSVIIGYDVFGSVSDSLDLPAASPNPVRSWQTDILGSDGKTYSATSGEFREADDKWTMPIVPSLPEGVTPERLTITEVSPEVPPQTVLDTEPTPEFEHLKNNLADCMDGSCILDLIRDSDGKSCFDLDTACQDWAESETSRSAYTCRYGAHVVALGECSIYRDSFKAGTREQGQWYNDPSAGWESKPATNPNPVAGIGTPQLFQPRQAILQEQGQKIADAWEKTLPGKLPGIIAPALAVPSGGGCMGPEIRFDWTWPMELHHSSYPLAACDAPMSVIAALARTIASAFLIWWTLLGVVRRISATVNAPGIGGGAS